MLLTINEGAAKGHRGHGAKLSSDTVRAVVLPLSGPSLIKLAYDSRRLATEPPAGEIQSRLSLLLGQPAHPAAAPVLVGPHVACVLVVGDPFAGDEDNVHDLDVLATALGEAYQRVVREMNTRGTSH